MNDTTKRSARLGSALLSLRVAAAHLDAARRELEALGYPVDPITLTTDAIRKACVRIRDDREAAALREGMS